MENRLLVRRKFHHKTGPMARGWVGGMSASSIGFRHGITSCFAAALCDQQDQRVPWLHRWSQLRWHWQNLSLTFQLTVVCVRQLRGLWDLRLWRRYSWGLGIWRRVVWCFASRRFETSWCLHLQGSTKSLLQPKRWMNDDISKRREPPSKRQFQIPQDVKHQPAVWWDVLLAAIKCWRCKKRK